MQESDRRFESGGKAGIVVKLGITAFLNRINLLLWDSYQRAYSYYIEVSMNQEDWVAVVDHRKCHCQSC